MAEYSSQQEQYPNLNPGNSSASSHFEAAKANVQGAMDSIANSNTVQSIQSGPVAEKARNEANQTKSEFSNLASSRTTPATQTATGQNLTHYHSFFYNLLSWENPRATAISYVTIVVAIFAWRYAPVVRLGLRLTWIVLGITAAAEVAGKVVLGQGFSSKLRPKQYYTIPREFLDSVVEDVEQLINFFVIEVQRIVFAENVYATIAAFFTTLITYFLIKVTPAWGLALLFTTVTYFTPLIYISNKELIDTHLNNATEIIGQQTQQVRELASQHTNKAVELSQSTFKDYSAKAQDLIGQGKKSAVDQGVVSQQTADNVVGKPEKATSSFPSVPATEPSGPETTQATTHKAEPVLV